VTAAKKDDASLRQAYEHVLGSIWSAYEVLIGCCHEIEDLELNAARNTRDLNRILHWVHETADQIYEIEPELAPPKREPPLRRWPKDPDAVAEPPELDRNRALHRLHRNLELARLILQESGPFARELGFLGDGLDENLKKVGDVDAAVFQEIWKDKSDAGKRSWIRNWGMPAGVPEPPSPDRGQALERLNQKLETAAKVLDDCVQLAIETELEPRDHMRAIATCMATIFDIQQQIYEEQPHLIPGFLKGAFELRRKDKAG
jgi:hypothetical protein